MQTASNNKGEQKFEFYYGYKNHILVVYISGLLICEGTTDANTSDSSVCLDILLKTNSFLPLSECYFLADKSYDVKSIYNTVKDVYDGECYIPLNARDMKDPKKNYLCVIQFVRRTCNA